MIFHSYVSHNQMVYMYICSTYCECHNPNWHQLTIFQRGRAQPPTSTKQFLRPKPLLKTCFVVLRGWSLQKNHQFRQWPTCWDQMPLLGISEDHSQRLYIDWGTKKTCDWIILNFFPTRKWERFPLFFYDWLVCFSVCFNWFLNFQQSCF